MIEVFTSVVRSCNLSNKYTTFLLEFGSDIQQKTIRKSKSKFLTIAILPSHMVIGDCDENLVLEVSKCAVNICNKIKYLGVEINEDANNDLEITKRIVKGRSAIAQPSSITSHVYRFSNIVKQ